MAQLLHWDPIVKSITKVEAGKGKWTYSSVSVMQYTLPILGIFGTSVAGQLANQLTKFFGVNWYGQINDTIEKQKAEQVCSGGKVGYGLTGYINGDGSSLGTNVSLPPTDEGIPCDTSGQLAEMTNESE